jgi:hypothetical protein
VGLETNNRRRWFGALVIFGALAMLIAGQTVLKNRLEPLEYLIYWLGCFLLTGLAFILAFLDVRALRRRVRQEQRDLLEAALKNIEAEARKKPHNRPLNQGPNRQN